MKIYIPTRGRINKQETLSWIPQEYLPNTFLVCPLEEVHDLITFYGDRVGGILGTPQGITGIAATRQWIIDGADTDKILMLDDDQHFQKRVENNWKLKGCSPEQMIELFVLIEDLLDKYPMVGLSARQGNNRTFPEKIVYNTRIHNSYGLRTSILKQHGIRFDEIPLMEDFNVVLRLLRAQYDVPSIQEFCWGQDNSNADGGCSIYRTPGLQEEAAKMLESMHRGYVKAVIKTAKSWQGDLKTRYDVRVSWKKARGLKKPSTKQGEIMQTYKPFTEYDSNLLRDIAKIKSCLDYAAGLLVRGEPFVECLSDTQELLTTLLEKVSKNEGG